MLAQQRDPDLPAAYHDLGNPLTLAFDDDAADRTADEHEHVLRRGRLVAR